MKGEPSNTYLGTAIAAGLLAVLGAWLPWVRKLPVGYTDGQPYYTSEWVTGLETGLRGTDWLIALLALVAVGASILARHRGWRRRPDAFVLAVAGGLLLWGAGEVGYSYWTVERYALEPGLYLLFAGGLLLAALGAGTLFERYFDSGMTS